ncbi:MAG: ATP-dependent zinc metalloprotease FtsH [Desulfobulbaceae bacterium]|nr:ATP-dependent zinc metalloprotease FtsH [Desulfobulbaceae bacterium]
MADRKQAGKGKFEVSPLWSRLLIFFIIWLAVSYAYMNFTAPGGVEQIPYTLFKTKVRNGEIAEIEVKGQEVSGRYAAEEAAEKEGEETEETEVVKKRMEGPEYFTTVLPSFDDPELITLLETNDVIIKAESEGGTWFWTLVITLLPWVLIIGLFVLMNRRMGKQLGSAGNPFSFGKSKAKKIQQEEVKITFDDVAGLTNAKHELKEMVEYLKEPEKFRNLGGELPKGLLLVGPPGTGKTLMARAMAGEAGVPFFSISGSEFIEMFVGVGAARVRDMFANAKKESPALIFIDELDSIGRVRGTGIGGGHDEREQTLNQILSEMDGFSANESVIVIAATNRPDVLDPALVRPGRFDRQISLDLPQKKARNEILELHTGKVPLDDEVDLEHIAGATVGFSGADLKNLVNEAALLAASKGKEKVAMEDFSESRDKIIMGVKREDRITEDEKKKVAYHEAGHALAALMLPGTDPLNKVTIIPRGRSMGATEQVPEEDRHNLGKKYLLGRIAVMVAGRAAEEMVYSDITTGAGDDLKKATQVARRMVCQWGMSEKIGPVAFQKGEPHPFLGRELTTEKDYSEATARIIDDEIKRILEEGLQKARKVMEENRDSLDILAEELIRRETLTLEEIRELLHLEEEKGEETD